MDILLRQTLDSPPGGALLKRREVVQAIAFVRRELDAGITGDEGLPRVEAGPLLLRLCQALGFGPLETAEAIGADHLLDVIYELSGIPWTAAIEEYKAWLDTNQHETIGTVDVTSTAQRLQ